MSSDPGTAKIPKLFDEEDGAIEETALSETQMVHPPSIPAGDAYLILMATGGSGRLFTLQKREQTIGRSPSCDCVVPEQGVSRVHARVTRAQGDFEIEDAGSSNGTWLNGERIEGRYRLRSGDKIRIGANTVLRFEIATEVEEAPTSVRSQSVPRQLAGKPWTPMSWRAAPALHIPRYDNPAELDQVIARLKKLPPLVTSWEVERLKQLIAEAQEGHRFVLQGGDCAERIEECDPSIITNKLKILLQMSLVLTHAARKPVIRIGRFAGQYAKPRSSPTEKRDGLELPSYVGDLVNRPEFTAEARRPDPQLLLAGYHHASLTLNFIRALCTGGFSDLRRTEYFDLSMFERAELSSTLRDEYTRMSQQIADGLHFLRAVGDGALDELARVEFFTSHEGLNLVYEAAQTRQVPRRDGHYCLTTHLPWIGERTRDIRGAHIEFFRGIANPIGVKIGPSATPNDLVDLLRVLNPTDEPGRIVLIVRMGAGHVMKKLPPLIAAVKRARRHVLWVSDPMHGNGIVTRSGIKTRSFDHILQELNETFDAHEESGTRLGGIHFELTGEDVTECIGAGISDADLDTRYLTACDPRLNYRQAIEMAFRIAQRIGSSSVRRSSTIPPPSM